MQGVISVQGVVKAFDISGIVMPKQDYTSNDEHARLIACVKSSPVKWCPDKISPSR